MLLALLKRKNTNRIPWKNLTDISQLNEIMKISEEKPVIIFKHSTRCSISKMALDRFDREYIEDANFSFWFLDLIKYREISNEIAERFDVVHQSPQVILIQKTKAIYHSSHNAIIFADIQNQL